MLNILRRWVALLHHLVATYIQNDSIKVFYCLFLNENKSVILNDFETRIFLRPIEKFRTVYEHAFTGIDKNLLTIVEVMMQKSRN